MSIPAQHYFVGLMSDTLVPLAIVTDYRGLVTALRRRIVELGTGMESVDAVLWQSDGPVMS
jgi:hypothetical protein